MRISNILVTLVTVLSIKFLKIGMALCRRKNYCFYRSNGTIYFRNRSLFFSWSCRRMKPQDDVCKKSSLRLVLSSARVLEV